MEFIVENYDEFIEGEVFEKASDFEDIDSLAKSLRVSKRDKVLNAIKALMDFKFTVKEKIRMIKYAFNKGRTNVEKVKALIQDIKKLKFNKKEKFFNDLYKNDPVGDSDYINSKEFEDLWSKTVYSSKERAQANMFNDYLRKEREKSNKVKALPPSDDDWQDAEIVK